jgi:hypothetical protein
MGSPGRGATPTPSTDEHVVPRYNVRQRKLLLQRTNELGPTEHEEIFKILTSIGVDHTKNKNGVFINLSRVPDAVVDRIKKFVDFCLENKTNLDEYDKRLNAVKLSHNYDMFFGSSNEEDAPAAGCLKETAGGDAVEERVAEEEAVAPIPVSVATVPKRVFANSKFHQAKKRFSKKRVMDRKSDNVDQTNNQLVEEGYV